MDYEYTQVDTREVKVINPLTFESAPAYCTQCGLKFRTRKDMQMHRAIHHDDRQARRELRRCVDNTEFL